MSTIRRQFKPYSPQSDHFDAGLEYLHQHAEPGKCYEASEIAAYCGVSRQAISQQVDAILRKIHKLHPDLAEHL